MKDYLQPKIDQNASPQPKDVLNNKSKSFRLVSSVAIAHVLNAYNVHLDARYYEKLFSSLILSGEPNEKTCNAFASLLSQIDTGETL